MTANKQSKAIFNTTLNGIMWALEEEAKNANESIDDRFAYKEIVSQYSRLIDKYTVEVIGTTQAIMFLCGRIAGAGEDYLHSIKTIKDNGQWCGKYRYDNINGKKDDLCLL